MGREPTSGNCHTCRRRRVKCDQSRPVCKRCQKSNLDCQGYEKVLRVHTYGFVTAPDSAPLRIRTINKSTSYPAIAISPKDASHPQRGSSTTSTARDGPSDGREDTSSRPERRPILICQPQRISPPREPTLLPFLDHISFTYFFDSYSWINVHSILLQDTPMRQHLAEETDDLGHDSLRALAYGLFGRDHHVTSLRQSAARLYGASLQRLQTKLSSVSKAQLALLVKPVAVMGSYSVSVDKDLRFTHHHGLAHILEHCGPENFTDPSILPLFESCRMTLISSAIVRRQGTFLEQECWRTTPWSSSSESKTNRSKLLDILAKIPSIIQATDELLEERTLRTNATATGYSTFDFNEVPSTVEVLQHRLECISVELDLWRAEWANTPRASEILEWALFRIGDDSYRPGIYGAQGPDVYGLNMSDATDLDVPFPLESSTQSDLGQPQSEDTTFALMQDASLYITVLIWVERLRKNLAGAARSPDAIDFYNAPFYTECRCYYTQPGPWRRCQIFPPDPLKTRQMNMAWNIHAPRISEAPVRVVASRSGFDDFEECQQSCEHPEGVRQRIALTNLAEEGRLLLPGDGRFAAQLRILNWLVKHLSAGSRTHVLGTLAAMGISHCVHDVRPSEGNEAIAKTIRGTMAKSGFEGAADLLLRNYG
ncbi:uncharacterized protein Z520_11436 [Fonsecaea multimorphosa CBS 102226]|uniref:Zn(2)-C6 fungal-type domain-containing protein n=1 Tax=Fonsecaea multimorphosa CBS 102226 TaxID=1442371 RepID=A0A0D2K8U5_9EURO|nr:uncharacterized protein Z520_11436 [Fonsecaea multimorphosa CBS 102226]KIX92773.1 hypothetical protein Z520_11436 [Fonsecaea multimorphosa CBS 102226]